MKLLKVGIRFWITITSVLSFLTGWIMLAHAPKPSQPAAASIAPLPTLDPLRPLQSFDSNEDGFSSQPFFNNQPNINSQFRPSFRTGGS